MALKYVAAFNMAVLAGANPTKDTISKILKAADIEVEEDKIEELIAAVAGKEAHELIEAGRQKISGISIGGAAAACSAGAAPAAGAVPAAAAAPAKEEEEEAVDFDLFD